MTEWHARHDHMLGQHDDEHKHKVFASGSETQNAKTMPRGPQDKGNSLFSPLLTFSGGGFQS